jgi:hypothetical protein
MDCLHGSISDKSVRIKSIRTTILEILPIVSNGLSVLLPDAAMPRTITDTPAQLPDLLTADSIRAQ